MIVMNDDERQTREIEDLVDKIRKLLGDEEADYSTGLTALMTVIGRTLAHVACRPAETLETVEEQIQSFVDTFDDGIEMLINSLQTLKAVGVSELTGTEVKLVSIGADDGGEIRSETAVVFSSRMKEELERRGLTEEEFLAAVQGKPETKH